MAHPPSQDRRDLSTVQDLTVTVTIQRGNVVVRALGVLDDGGAARVLAAVHCARQISPTFIVDLSGLTGADPPAARVLTHWWREIAVTGGTPLVIAPTDGVLPHEAAPPPQRWTTSPPHTGTTADRDDEARSNVRRNGDAGPARSNGTDIARTARGVDHLTRDGVELR